MRCKTSVRKGSTKKEPAPPIRMRFPPANATGGAGSRARFPVLARTTGVVLIGVVWSACCLAQTSEEFERPAVLFDIPAQRLDSALVAFSIQADLNVLGLASALARFSAPAVKGVMTADEALERLLSGTGLEYRYSGKHSLSVVLARQPFNPPPAAEAPSAMGDEAVASSGADAVLDEVLVTASRRAANLQNIAIAVTALQAGDLSSHHIRDLRDITGLVPGLEMIDTAPQAAVLVQLRGVGTTNITEIADGPIAIHVDGVYSPRSQAVAALLHDVERVEILRGPSGYPVRSQLLLRQHQRAQSPARTRKAVGGSASDPREFQPPTDQGRVERSAR